MPQFAPQVRAPDGEAPCVPATEFRGALSRLATTVSVITTDGPAGIAGVTCSAVCALSDDPAMVLVCIHGKSATNAAIKANQVFCVNSLQAEQSELSQAFAGIGSIPMRDALQPDGLGCAGNGRAALHTRAGRPGLSSRRCARHRHAQCFCRQGTCDN